MNLSLALLLVGILLAHGVFALGSEGLSSSGRITIHLAGDSTVEGWGKKLHLFVTDAAAVNNKAISGRSSKSFINEGALEKLVAEFQPGDYLLIQFGHNDQKPDEARHTDPYTTYQEHLTRYVEAARARGVHPVLITSVHRRRFGKDGKVVNSLGEYPPAVIDLGRKLDVPVIDLWARSKVLYESLGVEESRSLFLSFKPGEHPKHPDGFQDNTHFNDHGSQEISRLVAQAILDAGLPLAAVIDAEAVKTPASTTRPASR